MLEGNEVKNLNINEAASEARRFLEKVKRYNEAVTFTNIKEWDPSKYRAALRRASMDLTMALAKMRQEV